MMPSSIGYIRMPGRGRRSPNGLYRGCRTGVLGLRRCKGCRRCGGDGMIRVGTKSKGRRRGRRKPKGALKRGAWRIGIGGGLITVGNARFGTIGGVVAAVLVVTWLVLTLVSWVVGAKR